MDVVDETTPENKIAELFGKAELEVPEWKRRQLIQPPAPRQVFVSKRIWKDKETGELMTTQRGQTAKHEKRDIFKPTATLSKRQARKFRKATQKLVRPIEAGDIGFAN